MFMRGERKPGARGAAFSFIGPEVTVTGDIAAAGQLHIDGSVTGDVRCGSLSQGESGAIHGNLHAEEARIAGLVDGAVEAGTLLLEATARVTGDVVYGSLSIAAGAQIDGRFRRRRGGDDVSAAPGTGTVRPVSELFPEEPATAEAAE